MRKRTTVRRTGRFRNRAGLSANRKSSRVVRVANGKRGTKSGSQLQKFNRMLNSVAEKKYTTTRVGTANTDYKVAVRGVTNMFVIEPTMPTVGPNKNARIGKKIYVRYWKVNLNLNYPGIPNPPINRMWRVCLIWPKRVGLAANTLPGFSEPFNIEQYNVISDKYIHVDTIHQWQNIRYPVRVFKTYTFPADNSVVPAEPLPMLIVYTNTLEDDAILAADFNQHHTMSGFHITSYTDV